METLQYNLRKVFIFYCNNDPNKKKVLKKKKLRPLGELPPSPRQEGADDYYLSMEGVLKFLYNYSIIDRFVRRKALALILNTFKDYLDFAQFMRLIRLIAEEMYFDYPAINSTAKLKRMLEKLNLESNVDVRSTC